MFTGLIEDLGTFRGMSREGDSVRLTVETSFPMNEIKLGDSIAVNGVCLTVVSHGGGIFCADVSPESISLTTLGELSSGVRVNLERALRLSDRLGGHLVSGHVDAMATILDRYKDGNAIRITFGLAQEHIRFLVSKGSVTIDGISLTVNEVCSETFSVAVIPHSLEQTNLQFKTVGDRVNIETDILAKYVTRLMTPAEESSEKSRIDLELLAKHGFV